MLVMPLDLSGDKSSNLKKITIPLVNPGNQSYQVIPFSEGLAHTNIVVRHNRSILVNNIDYQLIYKSNKLFDLYGIVAYGALIIKNKLLLGEVSITAQYLGGTYHQYDIINIPTVLSIGTIFTDLVIENVAIIDSRLSGIFGAINSLTAAITDIVNK